MGTPKQMLKWGNSTLLNHAITTALQLNSTGVYVVLGANYDKIKKTIENNHVTILKNKDWQKGLGNSIGTAANHLLKTESKAEGVLVMLADQPLIDSAFLKSLISNFRVNKNLIIATSYEDKKYGVPVVFDRSYFKILSKLDDDFGAKSILHANESYIKTLIPPVKNVDLDSMQDYEALYKANFDN